MTPLLVASIGLLAALAPVVAAGAWCWHRWSAPLLFDGLDADEMVLGAVHRLSTLAYVLLATGFAALHLPNAREVQADAGTAVLGGWASVVFWLGAFHAAGLLLFLRRRNRREAARFAPPAWGPPSPVQPVAATALSAQPAPGVPFGPPPLPGPAAVTAPAPPPYVFTPVFRPAPLRRCARPDPVGRAVRWDQVSPPSVLPPTSWRPGANPWAPPQR